MERTLLHSASVSSCDLDFTHGNEKPVPKDEPQESWDGGFFYSYWSPFESLSEASTSSHASVSSCDLDFTHSNEKPLDYWGQFGNVRGASEITRASMSSCDLGYNNGCAAPGDEVCQFLPGFTAMGIAPQRRWASLVEADGPERGSRCHPGTGNAEPDSNPAPGALSSWSCNPDASPDGHTLKIPAVATE